MSISTDDPISFGGVQVEQSQTPFSSVLAGDLFCVFQISLHSKCSKGRSGVKREVGLSFQPSSSCLNDSFFFFFFFVWSEGTHAELPQAPYQKDKSYLWEISLMDLFASFGGLPDAHG